MTISLPRVLAVDDDTTWLEQVPAILEDQCQVETLPSIDQALKAIETEFYDIVLLDLNFTVEARSGLEVFRKIHALNRGTDIIVISGETNPQRLIEVFNAGVTRFLPKPSSPNVVRNEVRKVLADREERQSASRSFGRGKKRMDPLTGKSEAIQRLREDIELLATSDVRDILIQGATGTGKELLARAIAERMNRSGRFTAIHCGAIADGLIESELFGHVKGAFTGADKERVGVFEAAGGGFVFLDEIGEMPLNQQAKLLRVLQQRTVQRVGSNVELKANFRSITATHVDLKRAVDEKRFREDLYFRIAQVTLTLPPLRARLEDLPALVEEFLLDEAGKASHEITDGALRLLASYDWPGNIRQLKAVIDNLRFRVREPVIREKDICAVLPEVAGAATPGLTRGPFGNYAATLLGNERKRFEKALIQANGFRDEAAKILGVSRATFFRRAKEMGLIQERRRVGKVEATADGS